MKLNCELCGSEIEADTACIFAVQLVDEGDVIKKEREQILCQSCARAVAIAVAKALHQEVQEDE